MRVANILLVFGLAFLVCTSSVFAQDVVSNDEFSVSVTRPAEWTDVDGNDRAVFNFKHEESHSQIEVIGTRLMTEDVADVFFETFHETLRNSEFLMVGTPSDASYGEHAGTETTYTFTHSGVTLKVAVPTTGSSLRFWAT